MRVLFSLLVLSGLLLAEPLVVITHPQSPIEELSAAQLKLIYLKQRRYWDGVKLEPINLAPNDELRRAFENNILKMSHSQLKNYWLKQHYRGLRPPYPVGSVQSALMFVQKVKGAIAYIPESQLREDVKVLYREPES